MSKVYPGWKGREHLDDGDGVHVKHGTAFDLECCDCCLIHRINVRRHKDEGLVLRFYRHVKATRVARRKRTLAKKRSQRKNQRTT